MRPLRENFETLTSPDSLPFLLKEEYIEALEKYCDTLEKRIEELSYLLELERKGRKSNDPF